MTSPTADPLIGRTIGQYEILARLGGGGMGVVYRARDTKLGRAVALKFLPPQWSHDDTARQRFVREAQAASATEHRNICTVHDIAATDDGQLFIVMAYYGGQTLKRRLESGPLPLDEALDVATQVAEGLARAHAQAVVHRDIKPGNLILAEDGVRIVDFGLATFADALQITTVGSTIGTAAYMSPEQVRGDAADSRSDVWAAGIVLYEMLAGHPPFRGAYAEAISYAIRNEPPAPLRAIRADVPEEVEQLVFRAIHKDPAVRYQSGRELARALRQVRGHSLPLDLRTDVVAPPPAGHVTPARGRWRAGRVAAAAVAVLLVAGASAAWIAMRPVTRTPVLVAPVANQTGDQDLDAYQLALTQTIVDALRESPAVRVVPFPRMLQSLRGVAAGGGNAAAQDVVDALVRETGVGIVVTPTLLEDDGALQVRVDVRDVGTSTADTYTSQAEVNALRHDAAHRLMQAAVDLTRRHFRDTPPWWNLLARRRAPAFFGSAAAARAFTEGINWYEEQEYSAAIASFEAAANADPVSPLPHAWRSRAARLARRDGDAVAAATEAERRVTQATSRADRLFVEAVAAEARRDVATAAARHMALTEAFPDDATWKHELAAFHERQADSRDGWEAAVKVYHEVLAADPGVIRPRLELCRLYNRLRERMQARQQGDAALTAYSKAGWQGGEALAQFCVADALRAGNAREKADALVYATQALETLRRLRFTYNEPRGLYYVGLMLGENGRFEESLAYSQQALAAARAVGNRVVQPNIFINLGAASQTLGRGAMAADYYAHGARLYEELGDERRAMEQQFNSLSQRITYGIDADRAVADMENVRRVAEKYGEWDFAARAMEVSGAHYRNRARLSEAERDVTRAMRLAEQHGLPQRVTTARLELARLHFASSRYEAARQLLAGVAAEGTGRVPLQARLLLGRVATRLGDFATARTELQAVGEQLARNGAGLTLALERALGELAYEAGDSVAALRHFDKAAVFEGDAFVDEAAVEARAYRGWLTASAGRAASGRADIEAAVAQAERMGRVAIAATARLLLARVHLLERDRSGALRALDGVPLEAGRLGPELRAQLFAWRAQAREGAGAMDDRRTAREIVGELVQVTPADARDAIRARADIRAIANAQ